MSSTYSDPHSSNVGRSRRKLGLVAGGVVIVVGAVLCWRVPIFRFIHHAANTSPAASMIPRNNQPASAAPRQGEASAAASAQITWKQVSSFRFDWDRYKDVQVTLEMPSSWNDALGDPPIGDFQRVRIAIPAKKEFVFEGDWVGGLRELRYLKAYPVHDAKNLVESKDLLALKAAQDRTLLFMFGWAYASNPGSLEILELSDDGEPRIIFDQKNFQLTDFRDLDGDGVAEIVGLPDFAQCASETDCDKVPFDVYHLASVAGGKAELSTPLSETYNSQIR